MTLFQNSFPDFLQEYKSMQRNKVYSLSVHYLNSSVVWHKIVSPNGCSNQLVGDGRRRWQS